MRGGGSTSTRKKEKEQNSIQMREGENNFCQGKDQIDKKTLEISKADDETYTDLSILGEELPDHSPRFILLSYPLTMV
jgi:hypothetical protein